jgi:hypothetical protein
MGPSHNRLNIENTALCHFAASRWTRSALAPQVAGISLARAEEAVIPGRGPAELLLFTGASEGLRFVQEMDRPALQMCTKP